MARAITLDGDRFYFEYIAAAKKGGGIILVTWQGKRFSWEIEEMRAAGVTVIEEPYAAWARSTFDRLVAKETY